MLAEIEITITEESAERKHQVRKELPRTGQEEQLEVTAQNGAKENYSLIAQKLPDCQLSLVGKMV